MTGRDVLRAVAHAVSCPDCGAEIGRPCTAPRKDGLPHASRQARGVRTAALDAEQTHHRAVAAEKRVRLAGRAASNADVVGMLACSCSLCRPRTVAQARILAGLGLIDADVPVWVPVPGWGDSYQTETRTGRVRSVDRVIRVGARLHRLRGRILQPTAGGWLHLSRHGHRRAFPVRVIVDAAEHGRWHPAAATEK